MKVRLNLGTQVLLSTLFVVFLFGSINFFWVRHEAIAALTSELETRARHHAQSIAVETRDADLLRNKILLTELLDDTRSLDPAISYIFLVDRSGNLLAQTAADEVPVEVLGPHLLSPAGNLTVSRHRAGQDEQILDVPAPIAGGASGFVHVGLREDLMTTGVRRVDRAVAAMVGTFILMGVLASLLFTRVITQPVQKLAAASNRVNLEALPGSEGSLARLLPQPFLRRLGVETEVDQLADAFQQMVHRLSVAYQELEKARKQLLLAERLSALGTVAAGLAHELNNPLAGLKNCLRRIQREPDNREQSQRYVALMQVSVERMQAVVHGLLDLARPRRPEVTAMRLAPALERVALLAGERLAELGATLSKEIDPSAAVIYADEFFLEEALLNLVLNACDSLRRRRESDPDFPCALTLRAFVRNGETHIDVEDNGVGILSEDLPNLFDPFFTTQAPGKGTGLGLSIARDVIRLHGGDILVDSRPGAGAKFEVVLPEKKEA
jgi:two-component system NtrC family sensor kinase